MKLLKVAVLSVSLLGLTSCAHYGKKECKDKAKCEKSKESCDKKKDCKKGEKKKCCKKDAPKQA